MNGIRAGMDRRAAGVVVMLATLGLAALACGSETPSPPPPADESEEPTGNEVEPASGQAIVISDTAVVRSEPDVESNPVTTLSQGDVVTLKAYMPVEQWYLIDLSGIGSAVSEGWIRSSFLLVGVTLTPTDTPEPGEDGGETVGIPAPVDNPTASATATTVVTPPPPGDSASSGPSDGGGTSGLVANPSPGVTGTLIVIPTLEKIPTATPTTPSAAPTVVQGTP